MSVTKATVSRLLRDRFQPLTVEEGFVWTGLVGRRVVGDVVHVVEVNHRPAARVYTVRERVYTVRIGAHLVGLGDWAQGPTGYPFDPAAATEVDCAWRGSIRSYLVDDFDTSWAYTNTYEDAVGMVDFLASEWHQAQKFFGALADWPHGFLSLAAHAIDGDPESFPLSSGYATHPAHRYTWARVALLAGDYGLAGRIAEAALPGVPPAATTLRSRLEEIAFIVRDGDS